MTYLTRVTTPQLPLIHRGKVRDSFRIDDETRLIVTTDRISAFDRVLDNGIPHKGAVLNSLAAFWFERTREIVESHFVRSVDPCASIVREAVPIRVEMVVRGYLAGSAWRRYKEGHREICGVVLPDGLGPNARLPEPVVTPTTKEDVGHDRDVTPDEVVSLGLATRDQYDEMARTALELFTAGSKMLAARGLLLADTKYELGLIDGRLALIDEIHTPDSSRFWDGERWEHDPSTAESLDKEYVRAWLMEHRDGDDIPFFLPDHVVAETSRRYLELYERVTGSPLTPRPPSDEGPGHRLYANLVREGVIRDAWVAVVMGSPHDIEHCRKIAAVLEGYGVMVDLRVMSAHKNGEDIARLAEEYNGSIEPGAVIAVAGLSNGLGGALAASLDVPVLSCPPFSDRADMLVNVNSSLMMPSGVPAATVIRPVEAAAAALRSLNLHRLRGRFREEIRRTKEDLRAADRAIRGR
jgi:phosphoribosylaminoimidazole-succinocarboxamide synthase